MNAETKYNVASCLVWTSIIACTLSLIAIFLAYPIKPCNCSPIDANSVTVSILSIIVTILLGWNIYTVIDVKSIREDYKELKSEMKFSIEEQDAKKERLSKYVNIVQNFTMANVRIIEKKYGEALGIYCNAAIDIYEIIKDDESKWNEENDEIDLMRKCIENAYKIVHNNMDIKKSPLLANMYLSVIKGLKEINYDKIDNVKTREKLNAKTKDIINAIEENYETNNEKNYKI